MRFWLLFRSVYGTRSLWNDRWPADTRMRPTSEPRRRGDHNRCKRRCSADLVLSRSFPWGNHHEPRNWGHIPYTTRIRMKVLSTIHPARGFMWSPRLKYTVRPLTRLAAKPPKLESDFHTYVAEPRVNPQMLGLQCIIQNNVMNSLCIPTSESFFL